MDLQWIRCSQGKLGCVRQGNFDKGKACNSCHEAGHWKAKCLVLQAKNKGMKLNVKPAVAAVPVVADCVSEVPTSGLCDPDIWAVFAPVIRDGFVSMVGSDVKVPIIKTCRFSYIKWS